MRLKIEGGRIYKMLGIIFFLAERVEDEERNNSAGDNRSNRRSGERYFPLSKRDSFLIDNYLDRLLARDSHGNEP